MENRTQRSTGALAAPVDPFLFRTTPDPGLHVAFTSVDAGNLAFHVSGTPNGGPHAAAGSGGESGPEDHRRRVAEARGRLEESMGVPRGRTEYVTQVHSALVVPARGLGWGGLPPSESPLEADAIVSSDGHDPLAIMVADCLPVVFASREAGTAASGDPGALTGPTAVAHAGRRGLLDGILEATVDRLRADGAGEAPGDIEAWIGPGICGNCYEVPEGMRRDGAERIPATASTTSWGTPALDLPAGAEAVLGALGVTVHRIRTCTFEDDRLFSHRREPGRGRFTGLVWRSDSHNGGNHHDG